MGWPRAAKGRISVRESFPDRYALKKDRAVTREEPAVIYVVDDDPSVRKSLERLLRSAGYEVVTFASGAEFLNCPCRDVAGCLILDIEMPELNGLQLQERLSERDHPIPVIFITGYGTVAKSVQAMKAGALDFLQKPFDDADFLQVVSQAVAVSRQGRQSRLEKKELLARLKSLTPRERQVFERVVVGMLNKQIAFELGTAEKTVKVHRARVMEKMGAKSLSDLVRFGLVLGLGFPGKKTPSVPQPDG